MKMLHTSDWHLGRSFHQVGLLPAQELFVDHLVETVRAESVDAVLIAGDVYDRAQPAPATVELFSSTLERITDAGAQVVITSGNHDSAIRLGFAGRLLERSGVHLRTSLTDIARPVTLDGVNVYGIPYLEPSVVADRLGATERTHASVLREALAQVCADAADRPGRTVVLAHAFVAGGVGSQSERDISVGGVGAVPLNLFQDVDYAALGHLHGAQALDDRVRYSGSPVAMSFSEHHHTKCSLLLDLPATGHLTVETVPAPVHTPLALVRGTLDEVLTSRRFDAAEHAYVQVTLTDPTRPLGALDRVRSRFPHVLSLQLEPAAGRPTAPATYAARVRDSDDVDICCSFLEHVRGGAPAAPAERRLFDDAVEGIRVTGAETLR